MFIYIPLILSRFIFQRYINVVMASALTIIDVLGVSIYTITLQIAMLDRYFMDI